jgi:hypothetical protein
VPSRPFGRKISISTSSRYGRIGATWEIVSFSSEWSAAPTLMPSGCKTLTSE